MNENTPPTASRDAAWVTVPVPQEADTLAQLCRDVEALFRVNPYLYFSDWRQTGPTSHHVEFENQSNQQKLALDFEVVPGPGQGFTVNYAGGLKRRTIFTIEPAAQGSRLTLTDDYEGLPAAGARGARGGSGQKPARLGCGAARLFRAPEALVVAAGLALVSTAGVGADETVGAPDRVAVLPDYRRGVLFFLFVLLIYLIEQQSK